MLCAVETTGKFWIQRQLLASDVGLEGVALNPVNLLILLQGGNVVLEQKGEGEKSRLFVSGPTPRWSALETYKRIKVKRFAEIGVQFGYNAWSMYRLFDPEEVCLIDSYMEPPDEMNGLKTPETSMDVAYELLEKTCDPKKLRWFRESSQTAHAHFADEYFDFVYLDGRNSYEDMGEDIRQWYPKVRKGGILAGYSYWPKYSGAMKAVDELCPKREQSGKEWFIVKE